MATSYRRQTAAANIDEDGAAPHNTTFSGVMQPSRVPQGRKLRDQFRDKMRALHYALATEKAYRHWILEFLRFHRDGDQWKHPTMLGKPEIGTFLTHLAIQRKVSAIRCSARGKKTYALRRLSLDADFEPAVA